MRRKRNLSLSDAKGALSSGKSMDFVTKRVTAAMTVLFVRHCRCYDAFGAKGAIFKKGTILFDLYLYDGYNIFEVTYYG